MNRVNQNGNFVNKDFSDYAVGFGDIRGNFWIGERFKIKFIIKV